MSAEIFRFTNSAARLVSLCVRLPEALEADERWHQLGHEGLYYWARQAEDGLRIYISRRLSLKVGDDHEVPPPPSNVIALPSRKAPRRET